MHLPVSGRAAATSTVSREVNQAVRSVPQFEAVQHCRGGMTDNRVGRGCLGYRVDLQTMPRMCVEFRERLRRHVGAAM